MPATAGTLYLDRIQHVTQLVQSKADSLRDQCIRSFNHCGHVSGVIMKVVQSSNNSYYDVKWPDDTPSEEALKQSYDIVESSERGAEAVAFLLVGEITEFTALYRAVRGTHIDYWLGYKTDPNNPFKNAGRLEVSGIITENEGNTVRGRVKEKTDRMPDGILPVYVIVVEFSRPYATVVVKK
jgi:hypothetical protein